MATMRLLNTLRTVVMRLDLSDRDRVREDYIYPLTLKRGTLVAADCAGEEHLFEGQAIIDLDQPLSVIEAGEIVAYFPKGCFHVWNVD